MCRPFLNLLRSQHNQVKRTMGCSASVEVDVKAGTNVGVQVEKAKAGKTTFQPIPDRYETLAEVQQDLRCVVARRFYNEGDQSDTSCALVGNRKAGLESSNLIIGVDYTKSNKWTGQKTFGGLCLHHLDPAKVQMNPYQHVISIIGRVLEPFDDDNIIPTFGFGDVKTKGDSCFPFTERRGCNGFQEVLERYNRITPYQQLSGPTNFAPVIQEAIREVKKEGGFHILVIIADGQVTKEEATRKAIVEASNWPISIVMIGVGDGPWDMMEEFDDELPTRRFDNFQFVNYNAVMERNSRNPDAGFAMAALMEIPEQYKTIRKLGMLN